MSKGDESRSAKSEYFSLRTIQLVSITTIMYNIFLPLLKFVVPGEFVLILRQSLKFHINLLKLKLTKKNFIGLLALLDV